MVKIIGKTLFADHGFPYTIDPLMLAKSLTHHLLEQRKARSYPGSGDECVIVNAKNPDVDVLKANEVEDLSRFLSTSSRD